MNGNSDLTYWKETLQKNGGRLTKTRIAILEVIIHSEVPLTTQAIYEKARKMAPGLGLVTVYRTIDALEAHGLVGRMHGHDQCQTVFRSPQGHRHLLSCISCGKSIYFDGFLAEEEFKSIGMRTGFEIKDHVLQLFGECRKCLENKHEK